MTSYRLPILLTLLTAAPVFLIHLPIILGAM